MAPYIVTLWNGREPEDATDDVRELMRQRRRSQSQSNILVFVLNDQGQYVHSFDGMTDKHPGDMLAIKKRMPGYFVQELNKAASMMNLSKSSASRSSTPHLPTAALPAIRIYLTLGENRLGHFQVPVVEAVSINETEKQSLRYRSSTTKMEAEKLHRWYAQIYPPAVMDGHGGMDQVSGMLTYQPAGDDATHRYATLRGPVQLTLDNKTHITYQAACDLVLRYSRTSDELESVMGIVTTRIPRVNPQGKTVETVPMTVAIESIPSAK